jgi:DNA-binding NtrC family response regulator
MTNYEEIYNDNEDLTEDIDRIIVRLKSNPNTNPEPIDIDHLIDLYNSLGKYIEDAQAKKTNRALKEILLIADENGVSLAEILKAFLKQAQPKKESLAQETECSPEAIFHKIESGRESLEKATIQFENQLILKALNEYNWNKNKVARILDLSRTTLVEKIKTSELDKFRL